MISLAGSGRGRRGRVTTLVDISGDFDIPCVAAMSFDRDGSGFAGGFACRLNAGQACKAAISRDVPDGARQRRRRCQALASGRRRPERGRSPAGTSAKPESCRASPTSSTAWSERFHCGARNADSLAESAGTVGVGRLSCLCRRSDPRRIRQFPWPASSSRACNHTLPPSRARDSRRHWLPHRTNLPMPMELICSNIQFRLIS